jgi:hypothetical protein
MRVRYVVPTLAAILLLAGVSWCGELKPAPCDPDAAGIAPASCVQFANAPKDCGTANPHAVVGTINSPYKVSVAIDSRNAEGKAPDVVRLDFTGTGKFDGKSMVPLKATEETVGPNKSPVMEIGPGTVSVNRDGKEYLVSVHGKYVAVDQGGGTFRQLVLQMAAATEGQCDFGNNSHKVRLVDTTGSLSFTEPGRVAKIANPGAPPSVTGDTVMIDTGDGSFTSTVKAFYGQPAMVDGKWYIVKASDDLAKVSAAAADISSGTIRINHPFWTATFVGTKYHQTIAGNANAVTLPADTYTITDYVERPDAKSKATLPVAVAAKKIEVAAGKNLDVAIGSPLEATLAVGIGDGTVTFNLKCIDAGGSAVAYTTNEKGERPPAPSFTVIDSSGKQVYQATLAYG